jgi:hypothetical protein
LWILQGTAAINGNEQVELAFGRLHLGNVDVEVADRVALELLPLSLSPSIFGILLMPWRL